MKLNEVLATARDTVTVRRVFAEPYDQNGVTVIAAAAVSGGGGGGGGRDRRPPAGAAERSPRSSGQNLEEQSKDQEGEGGGFGLHARPTGAFIIRKGKVRWRPAVDVNRIAALAATVAVVYLVTRARTRRSERR